jgi:hypothetical protein
LAKEMGDVVTFAMDLDADLEKRKKAALAMAQRAGIAKFADALVRVEPYAEWVVLGISAVTYLALLAEGYVRGWLGQTPTAPPPPKPPDETRPRIPGGSLDDVQP